MRVLVPSVLTDKWERRGVMVFAAFGVGLSAVVVGLTIAAVAIEILDLVF